MARRIHKVSAAHGYSDCDREAGSGRCAIATLASADPRTWTLELAESLVPEDQVTLVARRLAAEVGVEPVGPATGAALRLLTAAGRAKSVVEIGTGTGVSALWLLGGMRADGVLTTIDIEAEHQRFARRLFAEAGYPPGRTRVITGRGLDVLPRLADSAYDLVFMDAEPVEYPSAVTEALRLLRTGGVLAINRVLAGAWIDDPTARDPGSVAMRETVQGVRSAEHWLPALLPSGAGLLCAVKRA